MPKVRIILIKPDGLIADVLCYDELNTNAFTVTVPVGLTPGKYRLKVQSAADNSISATSRPITIDDEHRERCVRSALHLLGLPPSCRLPYAIIRKIAVLAATD